MTFVDCLFTLCYQLYCNYKWQINISRTQKETGRDYKFSKTHQTTNVEFYDYNEKKDEKYLLVKVPIEKIANNSYSLNYAEYMKDETREEEK